MTPGFKIFHDLYSVWRIYLVDSRNSNAGYFKCKVGALHNHQRDSLSVFGTKYLFASVFTILFAICRKMFLDNLVVIYIGLDFFLTMWRT